ncbi:MAG: SIR2 family protein [Bacteroidales bacterium]|nr:SIR2 family protein [Bacteroidales bacterium]
MKSTKYKKIYILGSGFSKSVSSTMPTLKELTQKLLLINDKKNYYELSNFISKLIGLSNGYEDITTIERITSIIISKGLFYNTEERIYYNTLKHQLLRWIFERIEAHVPEVDPDKQEPLIRFFEKCCSINNSGPEEDVSLVITFNYDLLLERLLSRSSAQNWSFDYIVELNRYLGFKRSNMANSHKIFEYLKLHGSLNWFTAPGSDRNDLSNVYLVNEKDPSRYLIHNKDIPVYIPMAFAKTEFFIGSLYNVLWNIARRCLEETEEIVFIGYGFPQTDIDNLYFFLNFKSKITDIVVLEKPGSPKLDRLHKLFPDSTVINKDAFEYIISRAI